MTKRATIRQAEVKRVIKGALDAGMPVGSFTVEVADGAVRLLPSAANEPSDPFADSAKRMREAFGE